MTLEQPLAASCQRLFQPHSVPLPKNSTSQNVHSIIGVTFDTEVCQPEVRYGCSHCDRQYC